MGDYNARCAFVTRQFTTVPFGGDNDAGILNCKIKFGQHIHHFVAIDGGCGNNRYQLVSPLFYVNRSTPPAISFVGLRDHLVRRDQIDYLDAALDRAGVYHESWFLPDTEHIFDFNWRLFSTQFARAKVCLFLDRNG